MATSTDNLSRAEKLLATVPLIDGHNDFPYMIRGWYLGLAGDEKVDARHMPIAHTDISRLRKGRVGGVFWSAYVPCPEANLSNDFSTDRHYESLRATLQQIDIIHTLVQRYPRDLSLARTSAEVREAFELGRVASLIGIEGLHRIANSASVLRMFARLGVRYVTLTHDSNNLYADATNASGPFHCGLSKEGIAMVKEMNRIGISALTKHPRNSPDEVLDMLKTNGGVFMVSFLRKLTAEDQPTLERVADHIQYVGERIGYEHVGIGSDFDGMMQGPDGLEDVSKFPLLVAELLNRGIAEQAVRNVAGLNVLRLLDAVDEVSARMKASNEEILQDVIEPIWDEEIRNEVKRVRGVSDV